VINVIVARRHVKVTDAIKKILDDASFSVIKINFLTYMMQSAG
jgi:hypothetical protein